MYVRSVHLSNFRSYRDATATFVFPGSDPTMPKGAVPNVTLLLGPNGAGKTSILKAVALAVLAPVIRESGYRPYYLVRRPAKRPVAKAGRAGQARRSSRPPAAATVEGAILEHEQDVSGQPSDQVVSNHQTYGLTVHRKQDYESLEPAASALLANPANPFFSDTSAGYFLLGYGASRRAEEPERVSTSDQKQSKRYQRVAGLFADNIALTPLGVWLPKLAQAARTGRVARPYKDVCKLVNATLPDSTRFTGRFAGLDPLFRQDEVELPFGALSDGFRAYIALVGDILYHLYVCCPKKFRMADMTGAVMIDDIDLHLHPSWQRVVVPNLARTFPKLQFIITSHSPLVAGTLHAANVRVIGEHQVHKFTEQLHGQSVDQILTSPYFGNTPSRSPDAEQELAALADKLSDTGDYTLAVEYLRKLHAPAAPPRRP